MPTATQPVELRQMEALRTSKILLPLKSGGQDAENRYAQLYQQMVRRGDALQIKAKYR